MRYRIVDVFSDRALAGNALCVVLDKCDEALMPLIAREVNLSETTFPTVTVPGRAYEMRIFVPGGEVPFAGHPSLGTAWALGTGRWEQTTAGGVVTVEADERGAVMSQPDPTFTEVGADGVAEALGAAGVEAAWLSAAGGTNHVLVPTSVALDTLDPNLQEVARVADAKGGLSLVPFRRMDDRTLQMRIFAPGVGIPEDPGSGSAAGPVGLLARQQWGTGADVTIRSGIEMGRACVIEVHAEDGGIRVGGAVTAVADGRFVDLAL
jgi:trans-2,3-dihydro-3-hydroxyanthranilate isomerase